MSKPPRASATARTAKRRPATNAVAEPRRTGRITLKDVAIEANVSVMTVSNVINGKLHLVRPKTRQTVNEAIARLNYRPYSRARSLRLSREFVIGLIIIDPSPRFLTDAFTTYIVAGLSNYMNERGYTLSLQGVSADRIDSVPILNHLQTDALCVIASGTPEERREIYRRLDAARQPVLIIEELAPNFLKDAMSVRQDDYGGGAMLARHVLSRGARKLIYIKEAHAWPALENRQAAVVASAKAHGRGASVAEIICPSVSLEGVSTALQAHVSEHGAPDAVLCGNDQIAIAALRWFADQNVTVPDDVLVTGFNAFDFGHLAQPALTTVRSPAYELGATAGEHLLRRLDRGSFVQRDVLLPVQMELGKSA